MLAALAILAVLAIICTAVLAYGAWHKAYVNRLVQKIRASHLAEAGINRSLWHINRDITLRTSNELIIVDSTTSFEVSVSSWGAYLLLESHGRSGQVEETLYALVGMLPPAIFGNVISLIGPSYPLVIAGNTEVQGKVGVTASGVSAGSLEGSRPSSNELIDGLVSIIRPEEIPEFSSSLITEFLQNLDSIEDRCRDYTDIAIVAKTIEQAKPYFSGPHRTGSGVELSLSESSELEGKTYLFSEGPIAVSLNTAMRNSVLKSRTSIRLMDNARLNNCILVAPEVILENSCRFSGQIFSDKKVLVKDNASIDDLSFICLLGTVRKGEIEGSVEISSKSECHCFVAHSKELCTSPARSQAIKSKSQITLQKSANMTGILWIEGYFQMLGTLEGAAAVNLFYYEKAPNTYVNWIANAQLKYSPVVMRSVIPIVFSSKPILEIKSMYPGN